MENWKEKTEESLFAIGQEQDGSQRSYDRRLEIQRRNFVRSTALAEAQISAAKATTDTAQWTKISAICVGLSSVIALAAFLYSVFQS